MKYRQLGNSGLTVSEIGFGTWGLGGNAYGPVDDTVSIDALKYAFESGVNFYDTADLYGSGHSEKILGSALKSVRDKIIIATKVGTLPHTGFYMPQDFSTEYIKKGIEDSLKRLQTDYIDLYQLHSPPTGILEKQGEEIVEVLSGLQKEGKIKTFGISVRSPEDGVIAVEQLDFPVVQVNFNLIDQRAVESGLFSLAASKNVGIIARTPLCFGYLTGKLRGNEQFKGIDHRANWPDNQLKRWAAAPDLFTFLNERKDRSPAQLALRFCLDHECVSTVIPGMMNRFEVSENVATSDLESLDNGDMERIKLVYQSNVFFDPSMKKVQGR